MKHIKSLLYFLTITIIAQVKSQDIPQKMIVCSPITNLKGYPRDTPSDFKLPSSSKTNPHQITQLLFNDYVLTKTKYTDQKNRLWYLVQALQQPIKDKNGSFSYATGWVQAKDLQAVNNFEKHNLVIKNLTANIYNSKSKKIKTVFIGTHLTGKLDPKKNMCLVTISQGCRGWIKTSDVTWVTENNSTSEQELRKNIVATAQQFLGNAYSWGGRTPQTDSLEVSSVDCSGFVNLVFAAQGLLIPRNSLSQYFAAKHIRHGKDLQPGDLIFFGHNYDRINHVILYTGNGNIIESSLSAGKVIESSFKKRIGFDLTKMKSGNFSGPIMTTESEKPIYFKVYFASFLSDKKMVKKLIDSFLKNNY